MDLEYIQQVARETVDSNDARVVGLIKTWRRILACTEERIAKETKHRDETLVILAAHEAVAAQRGLTVPPAQKDHTPMAGKTGEED